ncbi:MAG: hypothetical protein KDK27_17220, partial [Leptospiraceae bacterium]|nr:hypothetical protein [Leptospiraceae bacterium]
AAESTQLEDLLYDALNELDPEDLVPYHAHAIGAYRRDPERLPETLRSDYWYRYTFFMASTHIRSGIMHLVGYVPVFPDQDLNAYTDGHSIHLPEYINDFKDPLDKEEDNRNLTLYIGLALHEAGHIVAGSFRFDLSYYLTRLEDPGLFRMIHNIIEDYRIEEFLMRIEAHPQVNRILPAMNEFYALQILSESAGFAFQVMAEMACRARKLSGRWKEHPAYARMLENIKKRDYNTGRFRSIPDMVEYAVHRLQCMDVGNPLIAYPLSRELYEVMKHWPREARQEIYEVRLIPTGLHGDGGMGASGDNRGDQAGKPPVRPLSREELESLYNAYDEDPEGFLRRHDLPVYPQLLPDKSSQEQTVGQTTGQATGTDPENVWNPIQGTTQPQAQAQERNTAGNQSADNLLRQLTEIDRQPNYEDAGTIDFSRRTRADDLIAEKQKEPSSFLDDWNPFKLRKNKKSQRQNNKHENSKTKNNKDKEYKTKNIYSIDPTTGSRTRLSEVRVYDVDTIDPVYMQMFGRWSGLENKIQKLISELLPQVNDELEHSAFEGDLNMELLHEILSDKNRTGVQEYLDIYREQRKKAEVVIGLDISGSTGILPPEAWKYPVL